ERDGGDPLSTSAKVRTKSAASGFLFTAHTKRLATAGRGVSRGFKRAANHRRLFPRRRSRRPPARSGQRSPEDQLLRGFSRILQGDGHTRTSGPRVRRARQGGRNT